MFLRVHLSFVVASCLLPLAVFGASAETPVYDFMKDFSADENPSGPWTIGSFNHAFSGKVDELQNLTTYGKLTFTKYERPFGGMGMRGWGGISFGFLGLSPAATGVMKNTLQTTAFSVPAGSIGMFPQNGPIVVRWLAPKDGTIDVRARFAKLTITEGSPEVWILHNQALSSPLHYEKAYRGTGKATDHFAWAEWKRGARSTCEKTISVIAKDTVDFVVDPMYTVCPGHVEHPDGNGTDIIGLSAQISYAVKGGSADE